MSPNDAEGMANSVDPDQTAPLGAVWSGSALFAQACLSENLGSLWYIDMFNFQKKKKSYIEDYLKQTLPSKRVHSGELEALKSKFQQLTKTKLTWTKIKSKRRRNVLTCREKKDLKLFDIPKDGQKWVTLKIQKIWTPQKITVIILKL